jgi:hypothetical protein
VPPEGVGLEVLPALVPEPESVQEADAPAPPDAVGVGEEVFPEVIPGSVRVAPESLALETAGVLEPAGAFETALWPETKLVDMALDEFDELFKD